MDSGAFSAADSIIRALPLRAPPLWEEEPLRQGFFFSLFLPTTVYICLLWGTFLLSEKYPKGILKTNGFENSFGSDAEWCKDA